MTPAIVVFSSAGGRIPLAARQDGAGSVERIELNQDHRRPGGRIATRRVMQAGWRLGAVVTEAAAD